MKCKLPFQIAAAAAAASMVIYALIAYAQSPTYTTFNPGPTGLNASNQTNTLVAATAAQVAAPFGGATGTGLLVEQTSPSLVTPNLGVAEATSLEVTYGGSSAFSYWSIGSATGIPQSTGVFGPSQIVQQSGCNLASGTGFGGDQCNGTMVNGQFGDWIYASAAGSPPVVSLRCLDSAVVGCVMAVVNDGGSVVGLNSNTIYGMYMQTQGSAYSGTANLDLTFPSGWVCPCGFISDTGANGTGPSGAGPVAYAYFDYQGKYSVLLGAYTDASDYDHALGTLDGFYWMKADTSVTCTGLCLTIGEATQSSSTTTLTAGTVVNSAKPFAVPGYTIATLPTCSAALEGSHAYVTNGQSSPSFLGTVSTTGTTVAPVFCNGSAWVYG